MVFFPAAGTNISPPLGGESPPDKCFPPRGHEIVPPPPREQIPQYWAKDKYRQSPMVENSGATDIIPKPDNVR